MGRRSPPFAALFIAALAGCQDDPPIQSLSTLCADLMDDVCSARQGCCMVDDLSACADAGVTSCMARLAPIVAETSLQYDSVEAARRLRSVRPQLDACGAVPPLSSFFQGGLANGAPCERDAQCAGGACTVDTKVCADAVQTSLCATP